jgi:hypothetical protein
MALTRSEDKLVAISGIAKYLLSKVRNLPRHETPYLAGLWMESFLDQLAWYRNDEVSSCSTKSIGY